MTDQISFLPMLDDAEHHTWLLSGKPGMQNENGVYVENVMEFRERRLRRALWLARAERASDKALIFYFAMAESYPLNINGYSDKEKGHTRMRNAIWWRTTWLKVERKCRVKAEQYK